jgi:hypothetical protein
MDTSLREIIVEMYKKMPKKTKEEQDIDEMLDNFSS